MTAQIIKFPERKKPGPRVYIYDDSVPRRQPPKPPLNPFDPEWWAAWCRLWGVP